MHGPLVWLGDLKLATFLLLRSRQSCRRCRPMRGTCATPTSATTGAPSAGSSPLGEQWSGCWLGWAAVGWLDLEPRCEGARWARWPTLLQGAARLNNLLAGEPQPVCIRCRVANPDDYKFFIFMNSSVRGPFIPPYARVR